MHPISEESNGNLIRCLRSTLMPSVLWCCWLGGRKGIRPVKKLSGEVLAWWTIWSEVQTCICPSWCHCHSLSLASVKSRLVLPFWYRPTRVVLKKGPLNGCVCVLKVYLSQGIVVTFFSCGGHATLTWNFLRILSTKNNLNHLTFDWVIPKIKDGHFYWETV